MTTPFFGVRLATYILAGPVTHGLIATNKPSTAKPGVDGATADRNTDGRCPNQSSNIPQWGRGRGSFVTLRGASISTRARPNCSALTTGAIWLGFLTRCH
jgi:hypothetical protein